MTVCTVLSHVSSFPRKSLSPCSPCPTCLYSDGFMEYTYSTMQTYDAVQTILRLYEYSTYCTTFFINTINFKMARRERKLQHMSYLLLIINNTLSLVRDICWTILCIQSRDEAAWGRSGRFCVLSWSCYCCILKRRYLKKVVTTKTILVQTGTISIIRH